MIKFKLTSHFNNWGKKTSVTRILAQFRLNTERRAHNAFGDACMCSATRMDIGCWRGSFLYSNGVRFTLGFANKVAPSGLLPSLPSPFQAPRSEVRGSTLCAKTTG